MSPSIFSSSTVKDILLEPIEVLRAELDRIVKGAGAVLFSEAIAAEGESEFRKACELGCEGIVSKVRLR
jgi:ATP-dependent DNA ligase